MYKRLLLTTLVLPFFSMAQHVGVGTKTPATRLHVVDSLTDVQLLVESPAAGSEARLSLLAGNNLFSFLQFSKYGPGASGSLAGISKNNLSAISTGGNAGPLLLNTGDGVSPLIFAAGTGERMRITAAGAMGIGTNNPATANNLHVHSTDVLAGSDVSIGITNTVTTDASLRGARFRMLSNDLIISNYEATGRIGFSTNSNERLVITSNGKIGINNPNPQQLVDILSTGDNARAVKIIHTGSQSAGIDVAMGNAVNNIGVFVRNSFNFTGPTNFAAGVYSIVGNGAPTSFSANDNYGVIGENQNTATGIGVIGISNAPSVGIFQAGVVGTNFSTAASAYGVLGSSSGSSGAGTVGYTGNATAGLLGHASFTSTGPAIKSTSITGSAQIGLEMENGAFKVSGSKRTAFQHTANVGNTTSNETTIPATSFANSATDLIFITPVWEGVYVNSPIGVYFSGGTWRIFRQDLQPMPLNAKFNVLVVKQ